MLFFTREIMFHCATLYRWLSFWQNSFNFMPETSHCCFVRLSVSVKKLKTHRRRSEGSTMWWKLIQHQIFETLFLRRHLGRWDASSTRNALGGSFYWRDFNSTAHGEWVSSTRYAVTNRNRWKNTCRGGFTSSTALMLVQLNL